MQRCYVSNTRTGPYTFVNSDTGIVLESVFGDFADAPVLAALNAVSKSAGGTHATTGQVSVYGTHWTDMFISATVGRVMVLCNEPTTSSAAQCQVTGGTPRFNSSGSVLLTVVGDQVTWEMPYRALGHTALANVAPTITGTNTANHTLEYAIDTGAGFGAFKTLSAANLSGETISPSSGFKLRIRATCSVATATNALTNIRIDTVTSSTAQSSNLYPLDTVTVTLTGLQSNSEVRVFTAGTTNEIADTGAENVTLGQHAFSVAPARAWTSACSRWGIRISAFSGTP
ncbi:MAG: hypothetical protein HC933_09735, partial [Pleurocapsa sp. SU_196_0]|nr:hypothetical protein [Pleurocapsa sp. SU_196_0]